MKDRLHEYITGAVQTNTRKIIIINGMLNHLHIAVSMRPIQSLFDLMEDIKGNYSNCINGKQAAKKIQWQKGYSAFFTINFIAKINCLYKKSVGASKEKKHL
jgi:putative transposase